MGSEYQQLVWNALQGVSTKFDPDAIKAGSFCPVLENADGYEVFQAIGKLPGTSLQSKYHGAGVRSINFYKYHDLAGVQRREILTLGAGRLCRLETNGDLTPLYYGLENERLRHFTVNDRIHLASPSNDPIKYDGQMVSRWGLVAPGSEEFSIESFDDHTGWTPTAVTLSDTDLDWDGGTAIQIDKTGSGKTGHFQKNPAYSPARNVTSQSMQSGFYFFVPAGALRKLAKTGTALWIELGTGSANHFEWNWSIGELSEGWNLLFFGLDQPDATVGSPSLSNITVSKVGIGFELASMLQDGFVIDHLFQLDEGAPIAGVTGVGAIEGDVSYRVVYRSKYGHLSNAGPPSTTVSCGDGSTVLVQGVPVSPDPQVIGRYLYRDLDGDALWRFVGEIADNTTTDFEDTVSNGARSTETPPLLADDLNDNRPPPRMADVVEWGGYAFGINARNRFVVEIMDFTEYESCPFLYQRLFDEQVIALRRHRQGLVAITESRFLILEGSTPQDFIFTEVHPEVGASGTLTVIPIHTTQVHWHWDGPYLHDGINPWYLANHIKDQIDEMDAATFAAIHGLHDRSRYRILFFRQATPGGAYTEAWSWGYGGSAGVVSPYGYGIDPQDLRLGMWSKIVFPASLDPRCSEIVEIGNGRGRVFIGCEDGYVYWLQDPDAIDWENGSNPSDTEPVDCVISGNWKPFLEVGDPDGDQVSEATGDPALIEISGWAPIETQWDLKIRVADSPDAANLRESSLVATIGPGSTVAALPIPPGNRITGRWASWQAENANLGQSGIISSVTIKYIPESTEGPN
jgi:hypothetical protein